MKAMEQDDRIIDKAGGRLRDAALTRCLEARPQRANSLDQFTSQALARILAVFRSSSDTSSSPSPLGGSSSSLQGSSPSRGGSKLSKSRSAESSVGGTQAPRRRFMRVVRDENAPPPHSRDDNPHIIPHYSQKFLAAHYNQRSAEEELSLAARLPYTPGANTILKKSSGDQLVAGSQIVGGSQVTEAEPSPAAGQKHASFFGEVEVIEYNLADKVVSPNHCSHTAPLRDDDDDLTTLDTLGACEGGVIEGGARSVSFFTNNDACDAMEDGSVEGERDEKNADTVGLDGCVGDSTLKTAATAATSRDMCAASGGEEAMMRNIFSAIVTLDSEGVQVKRGQEPPTKHIRLADLINVQQ